MMMTTAIYWADARTWV